MRRTFYLLALAIIGLHVVEILTLGMSSAGSLVGNSLQILASGIAAFAAFQAAGRGRAFSRRLWILIGCGMAIWGVANSGWMYYEYTQHIEPPIGSAIRFLFDAQYFFFAVALFVNQDGESPRFQMESVLDSIQIGIVFFFIFLGLYLIPAQYLDQHQALKREFSIMMIEDLAVVTIALVQAARARTKESQKLYKAFALYLVFYGICAGAANYQQYVRPTPTGSWFDLAWTVPILAASLWAASWNGIQSEREAIVVRRRNLVEMILSNATFALAPLIVLLQVAQLGSDYRVLRFSLLGISILCFAARLGLAEYRASRNSDAVRLHALAMDTSVDGMTIVSAEGKHIYVNSAFARMMGHESPEEVLGKKWQEVTHSNELERVIPEIREELKKTGRWFGPLTVSHKDGSSFATEMAVTLLPDGSAVCVSRDVTDRKSAEIARAEAETKYRMIIERVAAISYIAELGVNGLWHFVSPQVEDIFGYTAEEWLAESRDWIKHVPPEDHPVIRAAEEASLREEQFQAEYRIIRKDGKVVWVSDTAVVVAGSDRHPVMEGIIVDITERKQMETQLQQSHRMEAVGRLAGGIAHDFNNLLTIVKGYAELALNRPGNSPGVQGDVQQIGDAAERASALVRQLLAFSRRQVLQPKALDLNASVENLEKLLRRLLDEDIEMVTACSADAGIIKADPSQIEQVVMNLVVNARDAMPNGGRLLIETSNVELDDVYAGEHASVKAGSYVMLAVSDTGVGMDSETQAHIFEPFYTTKSGGRGTGLGLSTVYGIVKQSGGYIWVYSEPGKGSTFKVYLPRVEGKAATSATPKEKSDVAAGTETILLVEDEVGVRQLAEVLLKQQGYNVLTAKDTDDAQKIAAERAGEIHLLLTDVVMPGMSGRELAKLISSRYPQTRILYMSGYTDNVIATGGVLEPGVAFLQKPFTPRGMASKVREVLDAPISVKQS
jgi:two-component system cell cycle sensor histidine kinase/response regulator CckA